MSAALAERNLLTAFLALQMSFVDRAQFLTAMNAWLADKSKPLTEIFVSQRALPPAIRGLLETLIEKHLELHGRDPARSRAVLKSVDSSVVESLRQLPESVLERSLYTLTKVMTPAPEAMATTPPSDRTSSNSTTRFRILRPHARGGLGEVFVAQDEEVPREVALKQIQSRHADNAQSRARFLLEAEITGGLEHPGIVPVYGLGAYNDGRPFYAMRFIRGDSLKEAIERFHRPVDPNERKQDSPRRLRLNESARALELRKLLSRLVDVCQAIAYAHSRGVLHRDLKPGNIMLGKYGETLVVDWGLAKPQVAGEPLPARDAFATESPLTPSQSSGSAPTLAGEFVGTPGYASPEQACGRLDLLGPASDIYSLGGTLYSILTGQPPHQGRDAVELLRRITQGDITPPRGLVPDVPPALEAICLKALTLNPTDRYTTAQALADDLEQYLAEEPVSAYREPFRVRLRRWTRKHPSWTAGLTATILVGLVASGLFSAVLGLKNDLLEQTNGQLRTARDAARTNELTAVAQTKVAEGQRLLAQRNEKQAQAEQQRTQQALDFLVAAFRRPDPAQDGRELKVVDLLSQAEAGLAAAIPDLRMQVKILTAIQQTYAGLGIVDRALSTAKKVEELTKQLFGPDDAQTLKARDDLGAAFNEAGKLSEAVSILEATFAERLKRFGRDDPATLACESHLAAAYGNIDEWEKALPLYEEAAQRQATLNGPQHLETLAIRNQLAVAYANAGQWDQALKISAEVHQQCQAALGPDHPETLRSANNLAIVYRTVGQWAKAHQLYESLTVRMRAKFGPDHPETLRTLSGMALTNHLLVCWVGIMQRDESIIPDLAKSGIPITEFLTGMNFKEANLSPIPLEQALAAYAEAARRSQATLGPDHPQTLKCNHEWATAFVASGQLNQAIPLLEHTLKKREEVLGPRHRQTMQTQDDLGSALKNAGELERATAVLEECLKRKRARLGYDHPDAILTIQHLSDVHHVAREFGRAASVLATALPLEVKRFGKDNSFTLATMHNLSVYYSYAGEWEKAEALLVETLALHESHFGPDDSSTRSTRAVLIGVYENAEIILSRAMMHEGTLERYSGLVGNLLPNSGVDYVTKVVKEKLNKRVETCLLTTIRGWERLGKYAPRDSVENTYRNLIAHYSRQNQPEQAADWQKKLDTLSPAR